MKRKWSHLDGAGEKLGGADVYLNGETEDLKSNGKSSLNRLHSWADPQISVNRVLEHIRSGDDVNDVFLEDSINKKFVGFYNDITEECGPEDKQHSWAVLEKPEEVIMYGPYYPNYNNGQHSEDIIIKRTQELLESEDVSKDWNVYLFTLNSPCLARTIEPCMLNLTRKAFEWYTHHGVGTSIGYRKCWGFKGTKENVFKDVSYAHFKLLFGSHDYENYLNRIFKNPGNNLVPLCEILFLAIKRWLSQENRNFKFHLDNTTPQKGRKTYFKKICVISTSGLQDESEVLTQEITTMLEAMHPSLVDEKECLEEYLEKGKAFALDYSFDPEICDTDRTKLRLSFEQCWRVMVQEKYADLLRERLIKNFNRGVVQLFIKDVTALTKDYIQIGQIKFPDQA